VGVSESFDGVFGLAASLMRRMDKEGYAFIGHNKKIVHGISVKRFPLISETFGLG
jgi:hypothetical protein